MEENFWKFLRPLLRPARFIALLIALYFLSNINFIDLLATLNKTNLADFSSILIYINKRITFLQLIGAVLFAFLINPLVMAIVCKVIAKMLRSHTNGMQNILFGIRSASLQDSLEKEDRLEIFNNYSAKKSLFLAIREFLELIIPISYCLFSITDRSFGDAALSIIFGLLLSYLSVQKLIIYYLRYIAPYELIRPNK